MPGVSHDFEGSYFPLDVINIGCLFCKKLVFLRSNSKHYSI